MSTRSLIGILYPNNEYKYIYCHLDGYPQGVGATLVESYISREKINNLIDMGDIPDLEDRLEKITPYKYTQTKIAKLDMIPNMGEEYIYLWDGDKWICKEVDRFDVSFFNFNSLKEVEIPKE